MRKQLRLLSHSLDGDIVLDQLACQKLDSDLFARMGLDTLEHDAHGAGAEHLHHFISANMRTDRDVALLVHRL